ncbi:MAG: heavy-metal-associated domain-containing protein [Fervidicoccaceae archaeon]
MTRVKMKIIGVDCPTCVYSINQRLAKVSGFKKLEADPSTGEAVIEYDENEAVLSNIYEAIRKAGYDIEKEVVELRIYSNERELESLVRKINKVPGVINSEGSSITNNIWSIEI